MYLALDQTLIVNLTLTLTGGIDMLLGNFVTERLGVAVQAKRFARCCLKEAINYTSRRSAFKKKLIDMPVVRHKIAHMAREVSVTHAYIEALVYRLVALERSVDPETATLTLTLTLNLTLS